MKVSKLIRELKKMPQNLGVQYAHHDNAEYEVAGEVFSLFLFEKDAYDKDDVNNKDVFDSMPKRCVILRG